MGEYDDGCRHTGTEKVAKFCLKKVVIAGITVACPVAGVALEIIDDVT